MIDGMERFRKEKQFKADYGMTIQEAESIIKKRKNENSELLHLRALLNGLDMTTGEPSNLDDESRNIITERIIELESASERR